MPNFDIILPRPHPKQEEFINSPAKRKVIRAGRRGGKTVGIAIYAVKKFLEGKRVLYAAPTADQIQRFWSEITKALAEPADAGIFKKNETNHTIERAGTDQRIRAKTAWNADTLRGDYADELLLDEWQLMDETAWSEVGAPMLLDNNGNAIFIYTPPSLHSRSTTKARDPQHAAKLYKRAKADASGRWAVFHFASRDNPHISEEALIDITNDMTALAYRQEILAEDVDEAPGALWHRRNTTVDGVLLFGIEETRVQKAPESLARIVVSVDPSASSDGNEAGIIVAGSTKTDFYPVADRSKQGSPLEWATEAVNAYFEYDADCIVAEANQGGEMVSTVIQQVVKEMKRINPHMRDVKVKLVHASRGKATRAEPIAAIYEQGRGHHVGSFPLLEDEMCLWIPGDPSPNRMDALVWAGTELMLKGTTSIQTKASVSNYITSNQPAERRPGF
jgi:hypothetical protein